MYNGNVFAEALVNIQYQGRTQKMKIFLMPEPQTDHSGKWVIRKVESSCFTTVKDSLKTHFIPPSANETAFISLHQLNNSVNPLYFFDASAATDNTLLFLTEIAAHRLKIISTERLQYHLFFPGWHVRVEEFVRQDNNAGWLISNVERNMMAPAQFFELPFSRP